MKKKIKYVFIEKNCEMIEVPVKWLKSLMELSEECEKTQVERWNSDKPPMPTCIAKLIGFSSSARSIIKHKL